MAQNRCPTPAVLQTLSVVQNMHIGNLVAEDYKAKLRMFYTPEILTNNSLVFNKYQMKKWWKMGFEHAKYKSKKL